MLKNRLFTLFFCLFFLTQSQFVFSDELVFTPSKDWKRVYLASYPRSGSHWCRYQVEEASHIATGAVYCDREPKHMKKVFPWGGYCCDHGYVGHCRYPNPKDLVLIKTHFPSQPNHVTQFDRLPSKFTILLVRNPVDSFYSRYLRKPNGPIQEIVPSERMDEFISTWRKFHDYWNKKKDVLVIRYEDMLENPSVELRKILVSLNYEFTDEDIDRAVATHPPVGHMFKSIDKFSREDLNRISKELKPLLNQFGYRIPK